MVVVVMVMMMIIIPPKCERGHTLLGCAAWIRLPAFQACSLTGYQRVAPASPSLHAS